MVEVSEFANVEPIEGGGEFAVRADVNSLYLEPVRNVRRCSEEEVKGAKQLKHEGNHLNSSN